MPIYEYRCLVCGKVCDHLVLNRDAFEPYCKHCGSKEVEKLISRVRVRLSLDTRIERLADPAMLGGVDENDPRAVKRLMERFGAEFGDELGDDFDELLEAAEEEMEQEMAKGPQEKGSEEGETLDTEVVSSSPSESQSQTESPSTGGNDA